MQTGLLGHTEHMKKRLRKMSRKIFHQGGDLAAIPTPIAVVGPKALSPGLRIMFLSKPSLILMAAMITMLLEDNILEDLGRNDFLGGCYNGHQIGATSGTRFAQIPCIIRQVQLSIFPIEATLPQCLRPLLLLVVGTRLPVSCSTIRIPRRGLMQSLSLPHTDLDHRRSLHILHRRKALRKVPRLPREVEWGHHLYRKQALEEEVQIQT